MKNKSICILDYMIYIVSFIIGGGGGLFVLLYGKKIGLIDFPDTRSSHIIPTPKGGGIGIVITFLIVCFVYKIPFAFWVSVTAIALLGLYADIVNFSPRFRLIIQFIIAAVFVLCMQDWSSYTLLSIIFVPLWFIFIVGTANFYNFMDGINGIATITAIIALGLVLLFLNIFRVQNDYSVLVAAIMFSCIGFLAFNIPKTKVFMGDVGSILLGFLFAAFVFLFYQGPLDFICLISFLFPFYADALSTIIIRLNDREKLFKAHRRHLYQLLVNEYEIPHWKVSTVYGAGQLIIGMSFFHIRKFGFILTLSTLLLYFCVFVIISVTIRRRLNC